MFDLIASSIGTDLIDVVANSLQLSNIQRSYDMSSDRRSRTLNLSGGIDVKTGVVDITLNYRSCPKNN